MLTYDAKSARDLKRRWADRLLAQPGVVGVGVTRDRNSYWVTVYTASRAARFGLLSNIEGHPVRFIVSGEMEHQSAVG